MSNIRLFFEKSLSLNFISKLDKTQSHYLSKVMRINVGQSFSLFNQNGEWEAKVENITKGIIEFIILKKIRSALNEKEIWLAFAPIKLNYLNVMIQKATEIGVTRFIPILTERTIVRKLNDKRINKIIIEAAEQSNRLKVPSLDKLTKLDIFLKSNQNTNIIFGDLNTNNKKIDLKNKDPLCILIGPEGDFISEEIELAKANNYKMISLGNNRLRTETACIAAVTLMKL